MAVAPTGAIYKSLVFDGADSRSYGVYITGEAVYNAPQRDVEMVSIPGRSGAFALDKGRFENIEVTYPAGIFANSETNFAQAISDFRNFLCSRKGYVRLTDGYNPNEYRMAIYKSGLEVTPAQLKAGEFNITFDCKPQRWLTSGETAVTVASGGTLTNPTLFESSPLLEVNGYGSIGFNGYEIELENATLGEVEVLRWETPEVPRQTYSKSAIPKTSLYRAGDQLTWSPVRLTQSLSAGPDIAEIYSVTLSIGSGTSSSLSASNVSLSARRMNAQSWMIETVLPSYRSTVGLTSNETRELHVDVLCSVRFANSDTPTTVTTTYSFEQRYIHNTSSGQVVTAYVLCGILVTTDSFAREWTRIRLGDITANSSVPVSGTSTFIDCDLGEAYRIVSGETISLNRYIDLGSSLPKLAPGVNTVTKDSTITQLKITPRWWKI